MKPLHPPRWLARLAGDERALALTEFAFAAPVLVALGMTGLETAYFAIANLRLTQIAAIAADSASRVREGIDEADVVELLAGAKMTGSQIGFAENGRIILSSLEQNAPGGGASTGQWIRWQRCDGAKNVASSYGLEDKGRNDSSLQAMGPAGKQIAAIPGTAVMFVEVVYDYQPLISNRILGNRLFRTTVAFNVRQRTNQALTNSSNLPDSQRMICTRFAA